MNNRSKCLAAVAGLVVLGWVGFLLAGILSDRRIPEWALAAGVTMMVLVVAVGVILVYAECRDKKEKKEESPPPPTAAA